MKRLGKAAAFCLAAGLPGGALAETLTVEGVYGSQVTLPPEVEVIATESFGGDVGPDVVLGLSDILGSVYIAGEPFLRIVPAATAGTQVVIVNNTGDGSPVTVEDPNAPDAVLRGSVRTDIRDRRVRDKEVRRCVARDERDKCIERETLKVRCDELTVRVNPRILLVDRTGRQLYSRQDPVSQSVRFCEDEDVELRPDDMIDEMVGQMIDSIRRDLAPLEQRRAIRVMESRKNLQRSDRDAFRAAVRMTDSNQNAACDAFEALEANNPSQVSLLYNIGLCAERDGDLERAIDYYRRALQVDPGRDYPSAGLDRVASRQRGEAQMAARGS